MSNSIAKSWVGKAATMIQISSITFSIHGNLQRNLRIFVGHHGDVDSNDSLTETSLWALTLGPKVIRIFFSWFHA